MREFLEESDEEVVPIQNQINENGQTLLHFCAMHGFTGNSFFFMWFY